MQFYTRRESSISIPNMEARERKKRFCCGKKIERAAEGCFPYEDFDLLAYIYVLMTIYYDWIIYRQKKITA